MENNQAFVAHLGNIRPIEGADNIVYADVILHDVTITQVVTGKDTVNGTKIVYFDSNLCINPTVIDAIDRKNPDYGHEGFKSLGTYLGKNGRVRVVKLRGVISNGLVVETDKIFNFASSKEIAEEGFSFTQLGNTEICYKYVPPVKPIPVQNKQGKKDKKGTKIVKGMFPEHIDTENLSRNIHKLNPDSVGQLSIKLHGTSLRVANTLVYRKLSIIDHIAMFFGVKVQTTEYKYVYGSRKVTKSIEDTPVLKKGNDFYEGGDIYTSVGKEKFYGKLHQGEEIFAEIVGYTLSNSPIQKVGKFIYDYGCQPNQRDVYVYRITRTSSEGIVTELSIPEYKTRCQELNVNSVPQLWYGRLQDKYPDITIDENWHKNFLDHLTSEFLDTDEPMCSMKGTPREGVCLRIETSGIQTFKHKSPRFLLHESSAFDEGKIMDEEELN